MTVRIGWFSTGRDEAARNLLETVFDDLTASGAAAEIAWIFCHRELGDGPEKEEARQRRLFFELADRLNIPVKTLSHVRFMPELRKRGLEESPFAAEASPTLERWRDLYGEEVLKAVRDEPVSFVVMAGYMLIVGDPELTLDLVNIHPALPWGPQGTWQEVIHRLIAERASAQGIMVHLVTKTLDRGPVISYCRFPLVGPGFDRLWAAWDVEITADSTREGRERHPLFRKIRTEGEIRELPLLRMAIREIVEGRITVANKQVFCDGRLREHGVELTETIEGMVKDETAVHTP